MNRVLYVCTARDCRHKEVKGFTYNAAHTLNGWIAGIFGEEVRQRLYTQPPPVKAEYLLKHAGILVEPERKEAERDETQGPVHRL